MVAVTPEMLARLDERLRSTGNSDLSASVAAVGKPDLVRDMRRKGSIGSDRLKRLAEVLQTTVHWLETGTQDPGTPHREALPDFQRISRPEDEPPTIPVLGTGLGADLTVGEDGHLQSVETLTLFPNEAVDQLRRPFRLINRPGIYAIYFEGDSMEPKYTPGEPAFIDPHKPPAILDYVLVQLRKEEGDDETVFTVLAKRLVARSASYVELEQFNPPMRFRIKREMIARMHKILQPAEIYSV
ncbi:hypothetical protein HY78_14620 [Rhizorhabdus wittichii DC-6]|nr:hypothetical protein HY78_14620 [Rhizorhabdus wittichii DC-6]